MPLTDALSLFPAFFFLFGIYYLKNYCTHLLPSVLSASPCWKESPKGSKAPCLAFSKCQLKKFGGGSRQEQWELCGEAEDLSDQRQRKQRSEERATGPRLGWRAVGVGRARITDSSSNSFYLPVLHLPEYLLSVL